MSHLTQYPEIDPLPAGIASLKNPPEHLYFTGNVSLLNEPLKIAIVGSRKPFAYTKEMTSFLSSMVVNRGGVVVSGLAMGVDAIAHKAAKDRTIAVLGNGIDRIYPAVNKELFLFIKNNGLILSQYDVNTPSLPHQFIDRNRLVVALSDLVIITQADRQSGSLHSARFAKELGKPVFVLPHRLGESMGTHDLLLHGDALAIEDCDAFATHHLPLKMESRLSSLPRVLSLEEAYATYKEELYEWELSGRITIENGKVTFYD